MLNIIAEFVLGIVVLFGCFLTSCLKRNKWTELKDEE